MPSIEGIQYQFQIIYHKIKGGEKLFDKKKSPYFFIAPFFVMFVIFWIWPIAQSFIWSFNEWDGISEKKFVGFGNYISLFNDNDFLISLKNTILAAIVYIIILLVIALILGFLLNSAILKGRAFFRTSFFIPVTVSLPVVALIFYIIYARHNGVLNNILSFLGIPGSVNWLGDPKFALWSIVGLRVWRAVGYYTIFVTAGLQAIPKNTIEAGRVDGASTWQIIRHIILPQLKPIIVYIVIASSIWAFQLFEEPWILTQGGPVNATSTVAIHIYRNAFQFFKLGYASASAYALTIVIMIFAIINLKIAKD